MRRGPVYTTGTAASLLLLLGVVVCWCAAGVVAVLQVQPGTRLFVDDAGRQRFFHGVNVVYKGFPWHPVPLGTGDFDAQYSFVTEDFENLREWGQNIIRWGVMWPGVAPSPGGVNESYLAAMRATTDTIASGYGIWSLLDAHQDVLAAAFCGEGAPGWAVWVGAASGPEYGFPWPADAPYATNSSGVPSDADCGKHGWPAYYMTWAQGAAAAALYNNSGGMRDAFAAHWSAVARTFADAPGLAGYELLNEPWAGDAIGDIALMLFGVADRVNLQPFYDVLAGAIAAADPAGHIVMFEGVTWDDVFPVGFDHTPGNSTQTALSFHYYNPPNIDAPSQFAARAADMKRLNCGGMLTEFDISGPNVAGMQEVMAVADEYLGSWIGWEYKTFIEITGYGWGPYNPDGSINDGVVRALARTYPPAVAGLTHAFAFNNVTGAFNLTYALGAPSAGPTEIFVSLKYYYANGFTVAALPPGVVSWTFAPITRGAPHPVATPGSPAAAAPSLGAIEFGARLDRAAAGNSSAGYIVITQLPGARAGQVVSLSVTAIA